MEDSCSTSGGCPSSHSRRRWRGRRWKAPPKQEGETAAEVVGGGEGEKKRKYRGVRLRNRGRWVAEIREPNKRTRTWLGSYASPVAAARAYDTAVYCLYGGGAPLNFPGEISPGDIARERDPASMRQMAMEVGTRVDAALLETPPPPPPIRESEKPDLNLRSSDDDDKDD